MQGTIKFQGHGSTYLLSVSLCQYAAAAPAVIGHFEIGFHHLFLFEGGALEMWPIHRLFSTRDSRERTSDASDPSDDKHKNPILSQLFMF